MRELKMHSHASSSGYETAIGENGETLYMVGDEYVTEQEAAEYAQMEAAALQALGDPDAYDGYPAAIAPDPRLQRLDGCTCTPVRGAHKPPCAWAAR